MAEVAVPGGLRRSRHARFARSVLGCVVIALCFSLRPLPAGQFRPGQQWLDTEGRPIQAHGGGILVRSNVYYWYGEDRERTNRAAVACYSSTNLSDWKREGAVLLRGAVPQIEGHRTFVERPKVIFNARTGKYVMWMHLEQSGYHFARAGIAVADGPTNAFAFLKAIRPITNNIGYEAGDPHRQDEFGGTFRDMSLFVDEDGRAYVFYASEGNWTMYVVRLNNEFTGPETPTVEGKTWGRILVRKMREAPAPFKFKGRYYLITSACTGWTPNAADFAIADNVLGPYRSQGNPCVGPDSEKTFSCQSTHVMPLPGKFGQFIFMADRWNPQWLSDSRYVWLPFTVTADERVKIEWRDQWSLP